MILIPISNDTKKIGRNIIFSIKEL